MSKIHPAEKQKYLKSINPTTDLQQPTAPSVLTVWKRSSMSFQGTDGFTVFDHRGSLVFRVDNYTRKSWSVGGSALLLMDGSGKALLTLKPHPQYLLRMQHQWSAYKGEEEEACPSSRVFTMKRPTSSSLISSRSHCQCEAQVFLESGSGSGGGESLMTARKQADFVSEGSFRRRNSKITVAATGQLVAKISRKRINTTLLLNDEVFTLTVQPGFDLALVMAFLIILDRISYKTFAPVICSL